MFEPCYISSFLCGTLATTSISNQEYVRNYCKLAVKRHHQIFPRTCKADIIAAINLSKIKLLRFDGKVWNQITSGSFVWLVSKDEWNLFVNYLNSLPERPTRHGKKLIYHSPASLSSKELKDFVLSFCECNKFSLEKNAIMDFPTLGENRVASPAIVRNFTNDSVDTPRDSIFINNQSSNSLSSSKSDTESIDLKVDLNKSNSFDYNTSIQNNSSLDSNELYDLPKRVFKNKFQEFLRNNQEIQDNIVNNIVNNNVHDNDNINIDNDDGLEFHDENESDFENEEVYCDNNNDNDNTMNSHEEEDEKEEREEKEDNIDINNKNDIIESDVIKEEVNIDSDNETKKVLETKEIKMDIISNNNINNIMSDDNDDESNIESNESIINTKDENFQTIILEENNLPIKSQNEQIIPLNDNEVNNTPISSINVLTNTLNNLMFTGETVLNHATKLTSTTNQIQTNLKSQSNQPQNTFPNREKLLALKQVLSTMKKEQTELKECLGQLSDVVKTIDIVKGLVGKTNVGSTSNVSNSSEKNNITNQIPSEDQKSEHSENHKELENNIKEDIIKIDPLTELNDSNISTKNETKFQNDNNNETLQNNNDIEKDLEEKNLIINDNRKIEEEEEDDEEYDSETLNSDDSDDYEDDEEEEEDDENDEQVENDKENENDQKSLSSSASIEVNNNNHNNHNEDQENEDIEDNQENISIHNDNIDDQNLNINDNYKFEENNITVSTIDELEGSFDSNEIKQLINDQQNLNDNNLNNFTHEDDDFEDISNNLDHQTDEQILGDEDSVNFLHNSNHEINNNNGDGNDNINNISINNSLFVLNGDRNAPTIFHMRSLGDSPSHQPNSINTNHNHEITRMERANSIESNTSLISKSEDNISDLSHLDHLNNTTKENRNLPVSWCRPSFKSGEDSVGTYDDLMSDTFFTSDNSVCPSVIPLSNNDINDYNDEDDDDEDDEDDEDDNEIELKSEYNNDNNNLDIHESKIQKKKKKLISTNLLQQSESSPYIRQYYFSSPIISYYEPFLRIIDSQEYKLFKLSNLSNATSTDQLIDDLYNMTCLLWALFQLYSRSDGPISTQLRMTQLLKMFKDAGLIRTVQQSDIKERRKSISIDSQKRLSSSSSSSNKRRMSISHHQNNSPNSNKINKYENAIENCPLLMSFDQFNQFIKSLGCSDNFENTSNYNLNQILELLYQTLQIEQESFLFSLKLQFYHSSTLLNPLQEESVIGQDDNIFLSYSLTQSSSSETSGLKSSNFYATIWEKNMEQMKQLYGYYSQSTNISKKSLPRAFTLVTFESYREFLQDFDLFPSIIDQKCLVSIYRVTKLWEWKIFTNYSSSQTESNGISSDSTMTTRHINNDLKRAEESLELTFRGFLEALTRVALVIQLKHNQQIKNSTIMTTQQMSHEINTAIIIMLRLMDSSHGKKKLIASHRRSTCVRQFVYK